VKRRETILRRGAWLRLLVGASLCGCGGNAQAPGAGALDAGGDSNGGVGIVSVLVFGAEVFLDLYFAAHRDCDALPREDVCQILYSDTCSPRQPSPTARFTNAGAVTVTDGNAAMTYTPRDGFYVASGGGPLDPLRPLRVIAQGDTVPAFEAEVAIPRMPLTLTTPSSGAEISRSAELGVSWSGSTDGERADVFVQTIGTDPGLITCQPMASVATFAIPAKFLRVLEPGRETVVGVAPANLRRLSLGDWAIDVIAYGVGRGHSVTVVP
jgi:hypothetical protein